MERELRSVATDVRRWTRASIMGTRLLTSAATKNDDPHPDLTRIPKLNCHKEHKERKEGRKGVVGSENTGRPSHCGISPSFFVFSAFSRGYFGFQVKSGRGDGADGGGDVLGDGNVREISYERPRRFLVSRKDRSVN